MFRSQKIRPVHFCFLEALHKPPIPDVLVMPRKKHIGHLHAPEHLGSGILGILQKPVGKALLLQGLLADDTVEKAVHSIHNNQRCDLTGRYDIISDTDLIINITVNYPLVNTLVPAADKNQLVLLCQSRGIFLTKQLPAGGRI
jgi:hypothetical protein